MADFLAYSFAFLLATGLIWLRGLAKWVGFLVMGAAVITLADRHWPQVQALLAQSWGR